MLLIRKEGETGGGVCIRNNEQKRPLSTSPRGGGEGPISAAGGKGGVVLAV